jgi:hypothetical protein
MPRVGEFSAANITRLLLSVAIAVFAAIAVGYWFFYSAGRGHLIENHPSPSPPPTLGK